MFQDTVTGFLLTGIGERNSKGETNFLIVDSRILTILWKTFNIYIDTTAK